MTFCFRLIKNPCQPFQTSIDLILPLSASDITSKAANDLAGCWRSHAKKAQEATQSLGRSTPACTRTRERWSRRSGRKAAAQAPAGIDS
jgi:hypothetical protein